MAPTTPMPDETRSEYNITFWYWRATDLWLAFYPCLPHYKGTGRTMEMALDDLRSRERAARTDGEITFYSLGSQLFARMVAGRGDQPKWYGVGCSTSEALADLVGVDSDTSFRYVDKEWICSNFMSRCTGRGKTAYEAAMRATTARNVTDCVNVPCKRIEVNEDGFSVGSKGSSAVGTGKTIEEAVKSFWLQESKSVVEQCQAIINTHGTEAEISGFNRLLKRAGLI